MSKKEIGDYGEKLAQRYLRRRFYRIIETNYKTKHGEIDIIAKNRKHLVFCEVKTRSCTEALKYFGNPASAVNYKKQQHILSAVKEYLYFNNTSLNPRIDIIEVYLDFENRKKYRIEHIENAFGE
ncbi:MAG: YraN family protein [Clostridia bacterium]|nr:YraN family protein [Clostridia bacterium]